MPPGATGHSESGATRNDPNPELRRIREQERHETREQFAAAMARIARETGLPVIPDAKYVARLETGEIRYPGPAYRRILAELCGRPFGALGFGPAPSLSVPESADADADSVKGGNAVPPAGRLNMALRNAVLSSGLELPQIARRAGVDPKSVQRWITRGVVPHPRHRWKTCEILGADESDLWPDAVYERERHKARAGFAARANGKPDSDSPVSEGDQPVRHDSGLLDLADDMNRRELLRILSMTGTMLAISPAHDNIDWERLDYFADRGGILDSQAVEEYASLNMHLWRVFVLSRTKRVVFPLVRDQLDILTSSFGRVTGPVV